MDKTSYCIACAGGSVWLGAVQDSSGMYLCDVEAAPQRGSMQFWSVVPLPGTDSYYLFNETAEQFACFEADGKPITLRPLDVLEVEPAEEEPPLRVLEGGQPPGAPRIEGRLRHLAVGGVARARDDVAHALEVRVGAVDVRLLGPQLGVAHRLRAY